MVAAALAVICNVSLGWRSLSNTSDFSFYGSVKDAVNK